MASPNLNPYRFYVYVLFREDGETPFYIGKGHGRRLFHHERDAHKGTDNPLRDRIILAILAKGIELPKLKLLEGLTDEIAKQIECDLIRLIGRFPNGPLVNLTDGGDGVSNLPPESRARMGGWRGRQRSEETKAKLRLANLGKRHSAETKAKLSLISRNMPPESRARSAAASRNMSPETRAKIGAASRGRVKSPETIAKLRAAQTPELRAKAAAIRAAANRARIYTPEMRAKMSLIARNRSPEWRQRQSESKRGKKFSEATRAKLSAARRGKKLSASHAEKIGAWHRGRKRGVEARENIKAGIARARQKK